MGWEKPWEVGTGHVEALPHPATGGARLARRPRRVSAFLAIKWTWSRVSVLTVVNGQNDVLAKTNKKWIQMRKPV